MPVANATKMKVYWDSVPKHCQVATDTYTVAVDYLDASGNVVTTVVHDRASIGAIAKRDDMEVIDHYVGEADGPLAGVEDDDAPQYSSERPEPPAANASTDEWRAYRLAQGHDPEELDGLGRNELRDDVADPEGWDA